MKALLADQGFIFITALLAVTALIVTPRHNYTSFGSRLRWATLFFIIWMVAFVSFSWDTISAIWISN
jgi:hypothetical protein